MSSKKEPNLTIEPLKLRNKVKKKATIDDTKFRRKVRSDHGYPLITLPKWMLKFGLKLNQDVIIEKRGTNPLNWELVIKVVTVQKKHSAEAKQ